MKLHEHFKTFLKDHVNLNETRLSLLTASVDAVQSAVRQLDWGPKILGFEEQGSWAHGTIIKPQSGSSFDADLLVLVEPVPDWTPRDYVNKLATELNLMPAYKDKVRRFSHCATIEYAGERKIDIAPVWSTDSIRARMRFVIEAAMNSNGPNRWPTPIGSLGRTALPAAMT